MNPELLKKCLSGKADASEWIAYQLWLEGDPDLEESDLSMSEELGDGEHLWQKVALQNQQSDKQKRYKKRFILTVAASLVLVLGVAFLFKHQSSNMDRIVFKQTNNIPFLEKEFEGLRFKLGKNSQIKMKDQGDDRMDVQFTGNMMLSNTSGRDRDTKFFYTQTNGEQTSKKFRLKKDRTYYLSSNSSNNDHLLIIEERAFMDMPPVLARNLKSEFNQL